VGGLFSVSVTVESPTFETTIISGFGSVFGFS